MKKKDRQTDGKIDRQIDRLIDMQINRQIDRCEANKRLKGKIMTDLEKLSKRK